ncbi:hypothetical protein [Actinomadura sp. NPDC049753]|uniref:hypothetical protein n=1 Tax=Actinomadura sp. NPDC049753 TaxID=3154739 RepID=UPI0034165421
MRDPDGFMTGVNLPYGEGEIDARESVHGARAATAPPPDTAQFDRETGCGGPGLRPLVRLPLASA